MLAFPEDSFCRTFDLYDFGDSEEDKEKVVFEAVGAEIDYDLIDYDCFDASSVLSSRCSSTGTPSCSSSPCSSDREYGFEASSLPDSFYDIDDDNFDFDMDFRSCSAPSKRSKHIQQEESRNKIKRRGKCSSKSRQRRRKELDVILTCADCRWSELSTRKQQEVLEMLIGMVSQKLGLREQLQLIRLISPDADVSPTDKEFFIDFDLFDDEKFKGVCNFVKRHLFTMKDTENSISDSDRYSRKKSKRTPELEEDGSIWNEKGKSVQKKVLAKTSKQIKKEKRSGLFKKEQVLLIKEDKSSLPEEEELDVVS